MTDNTSKKAKFFNTSTVLSEPRITRHLRNKHHNMRVSLSKAATVNKTINILGEKRYCINEVRQDYTL